jgi:hypothetical protein
MHKNKNIKVDSGIHNKEKYRAERNKISGCQNNETIKYRRGLSKGH